MKRSDVLRDVVAGHADEARCAELAVELGLPEADLFVLAGLPVPDRWPRRKRIA